MGTSAVTVQDQFLASISDYKLDALFATSGSQALATYMEPWLMRAVQKFKPICDQELVYSTTSGEFSVDLSDKNILLLAKIMLLPWMEKGINDVAQFQVHIQDSDFKTHSAAQNLSAKREMYNQKVEEVSQLMQDYAYDENDWANWRNGIYYS